MENWGRKRACTLLAQLAELLVNEQEAKRLMAHIPSLISFIAYENSLDPTALCVVLMQFTSKLNSLNTFPKLYAILLKNS